MSHPQHDLKSTSAPAAATQTPASQSKAPRAVHPVLAEVLAEKEPDTVSWVKG
jgi:hypothetical protein